jgi:parallel beta-helix repeat protein
MFFCLIIPTSLTYDSLNLSYDPISNGNTLYVGGVGEGNYSKIQYAIDNATDGDTVFVYNGKYYENIEAEKSINLIGEDRENTIIDGNGNYSVILFKNMYLVEGVSVKKFTIQNGSTGIAYSTGINKINESKHFHKSLIRPSGGFSNNIIINNEIGIGVGWRSEYIFIADNIITNNKKGIEMDCYSWYNFIINNTIKDNDYGIYGHGILSNIFLENDITSNNNDGIYFRSYCNDNEINNNKLFNNYNGIFFDYDCGGNIISNNNISSNTKNGINFIRSESNNINDNTIIGNVLGISLYLSSHNKIENNDISNQKNYAAIRLYFQCDHNKINDNILSNNEHGIIIRNSNENDITNNIISKNVYGLNIYRKSRHNNVSENIISDNIYGIIIGNPIFAILSIEDLVDRSIFNDIIKNNFEKNKYHSYIDGCLFNKWDQNYWSRSRFFPKIIFGHFLFLPWFNIDWNPAKEPYDF